MCGEGGGGGYSPGVLQHPVMRLACGVVGWSRTEPDAVALSFCLGLARSCRAVCSSAPATASSCVYFSAEVHGYPRLPFPPQGALVRVFLLRTVVLVFEDAGSVFEASLTRVTPAIACAA